MVGAIALSSSQISQKSLMFMFGWVLAESGVGISILVRGGGNLKGQLDIIPSTTLFFKIKKKHALSTTLTAIVSMLWYRLIPS